MAKRLKVGGSIRIGGQSFKITGRRGGKIFYRGRGGRIGSVSR